MTVLYWQLAVIASVALVFVFKSERAAWWTALFWSAWTIARLAYEPLILIQLLSAWGTFGLGRYLRNLGRERDAFQRHLEEILRSVAVPDATAHAVANACVARVRSLTTAIPCKACRNWRGTSSPSATASTTRKSDRPAARARAAPSIGSQ